MGARFNPVFPAADADDDVAQLVDEVVAAIHALDNGRLVTDFQHAPKRVQRRVLTELQTALRGLRATLADLADQLKGPVH